MEMIYLYLYIGAVETDVNNNDVRYAVSLTCGSISLGVRTAAAGIWGDRNKVSYQKIYSMRAKKNKLLLLSVDYL